MPGAALECEGASKFGALLRGGGGGRSSGTPNEMISTMLETSFAIRSGKPRGRSLPTSFKLQRYIASANSGKSSCPDFVVSESILRNKQGSAKLEFDLPYLHEITAREFGPDK